MRIPSVLIKKAYYRSHGVRLDDMRNASWLKSSSSNMDGSCVEVSRLTCGRFGVRDTKDNEVRPVLVFTGPEWAAFLAGAKGCQFDNL